MKAKVGDKVLIKSNVFGCPAIWGIVTGFTGVGNYIIDGIDELNRTYPTLKHTKNIQGVYESRILEVRHGGTVNSKNIDVQEFLAAVKNCDGATDIQRQNFADIVLGNTHFGYVTSYRIISCTKNWVGGCDDAKEKFLNVFGLSLKPQFDPSEKFTLEFTREQLERIWALSWVAEIGGHEGSEDQTEGSLVRTRMSALYAQRIHRHVPDTVIQSAKKRFNR